MPEIGTSGSMSGDGKRGVAEWPKLPRPSSTLPSRPILSCRTYVSVRGKAECRAASPLHRSKMTSRPEEFHLRALPEPCMTLSSHTAPDVRPLP